MLITFLIANEFEADGRSTGLTPKSKIEPRYILEDVEIPREPQLGSLVCLIRDDGKGVYFRVNQVIWYPHAPTPLTVCHSDDWGILVQVILDPHSPGVKEEDLLHICVYANPYTPGGKVWREQQARKS